MLTSKKTKSKKSAFAAKQINKALSGLNEVVSNGKAMPLKVMLETLRNKLRNANVSKDTQHLQEANVNGLNSLIGLIDLMQSNHGLTLKNI